MSEEQMIQQTAARLFADAEDAALTERVEAGEFPADLWERIESAGFHLSLVPGDGGFGLSIEQALPIHEELGRYRLPVPLAETSIGLALLSAGGIALPEGPGTVIDRGPGNSLKLERRQDRQVLAGRAYAVPWGRHARWTVAALDSGELAFLSLGQGENITVQTHRDLAGMPADTVDFKDASVEAVIPAGAQALRNPVRTMGALVHASMMTGAMEWTLEQAIRHANDRVQFGRPIGKNQAVQQALAQAAGDLAAARVASRMAAQDAGFHAGSSTGRTDFSVAVAKMRCGEAATRVAAVAHQVLGAMGFTREHQLHFATRRLLAWREAYGSDAWWAQRLGEAAIRSRSAGFWPAVVHREFSTTSIDL